VRRHRTRSGRLLDVELTSHHIEFEGRRAELVLAEDISARRAAMLERERLFTAIEQFPDSGLITDRAGNIEYVNPAFERSSGYSRAEVLGRNPRILKSGQQTDDFYRDMWAALTSGRSWTGRIVNRRKDGTLFTEEASLSPVREPGGAIVSFVAVKRDVSRQLELEAQYLQSQKLESIGRLAAGVAHDFNNLLTIIYSTAEMAALDAPPASQLAEDLREIRSASERGAALTRQLLSFTRQQAVKPVVLEPDVVIHGFEKLLRRLLSEDMHLEVRTGAQHCRVLADPGQLEQVVLNLTVNARDAISAGGRICIETSRVEALDPATKASLRPSAPRDPCIKLSVSDTGAGMPPEVLDQLFTPFFTTKELGKGTGLGLSTVLRLVSEARGGICVRSEPGRGSTFDIYLPLVDEEPSTSESSSAQGAVARAAAMVLVVEDDETVRPVTTRMLRRAGYQAVSATNGREALDLIERGAVKPTIVLTDMVMPEMGGLELAERLSHLAPEVPVLFVSGYAPQGGEALPPDRFLAKPYTADALLAAVGRALGSKLKGP
jgi:PAS domain S-box-containing protein